MKYLYGIIIIILVSCNIETEPNTVIAKVKVFKSDTSTSIISRSTHDKVLKDLNKGPFLINLEQGEYTQQKYDTTGFSKFELPTKDSLLVRVDTGYGKYRFRYPFPKNPNDTIVLWISDYAYSCLVDSIIEPEFYTRFGPHQAIIDFNNNDRKMLAGGFINSYKRNEKYNFYYSKVVGCESSTAITRIVYKYNKKMLELMGLTFQEFYALREEDRYK